MWGPKSHRCALCSRVRFPYKNSMLNYSRTYSKNSWLQSGVNETAVICTAQRYHSNRGIWSCCIIDTTGSNPAVSFELCKRLFKFSWLIRSHMRNEFSPWIRALGGIVWWKKTEGQKSCHTLPLRKMVTNQFSYENYPVLLKKQQKHTVIFWAKNQHNMFNWISTGTIF
jgi:hypothetical protein